MPLPPEQMTVINKWLSAFKPRCFVCGGTQWRPLPDLVGMALGPVDINRDPGMPSAHLIYSVGVDCAGCGYRVLVSLPAVKGTPPSQKETNPPA
jgi:hypothetical protein